MKRDVRIGKLILNRTALVSSLLCLFLNGMTIGAMVAHYHVSQGTINVPILFILLFAPYLIFYNTLKKNIVEIK